jgi:hypothetical protein
VIRLPKDRRVVAAIVAAIVIAIVVVVIAVSGSDDPAVPPKVTSSTLAQGPGGSSPSVAGTIVTIVGTVQKLDPSGDFVINNGHVDYTIAMSPLVKIADLGGTQLSPNVIQVGTSIQVTGALAGSTITAQSVVVPTSGATNPPTS